MKPLRYKLQNTPYKLKMEINLSRQGYYYYIYKHKEFVISSKMNNYFCYNMGKIYHTIGIAICTKCGIGTLSLDFKFENIPEELKIYETT